MYYFKFIYLSVFCSVKLQEKYFKKHNLRKIFVAFLKCNLKSAHGAYWAPFPCSEWFDF